MLFSINFQCYIFFVVVCICYVSLCLYISYYVSIDFSIYIVTKKEYIYNENKYINFTIYISKYEISNFCNIFLHTFFIVFLYYDEFLNIEFNLNFHTKKKVKNKELRISRNRNCQTKDN